MSNPGSTSCFKSGSFAAVTGRLGFSLAMTGIKNGHVIMSCHLHTAPNVTQIDTNPNNPCMVFFPTFTWCLWVNVGKYTIHGWYGKDKKFIKFHLQKSCRIRFEIMPNPPSILESLGVWFFPLGVKAGSLQVQRNDFGGVHLTEMSWVKNRIHGTNGISTYIVGWFLWQIGKYTSFYGSQLVYHDLNTLPETNIFAL